MIGDTGEPCGTSASTGWLSMALPSIIISTVLSHRQLSVHRIRSPSICLTIIKLTSPPFATRRKAASMSMRSTPVLWAFVRAAWALSTMIAAASMADHPILLPNCPSLSNHLRSATSDNSPETTFRPLFPCSSAGIWSDTPSASYSRLCQACDSSPRKPASVSLGVFLCKWPL